jgi:DNA integrity scanning protein DisA with diadenylate cyclase activity
MIKDKNYKWVLGGAILLTILVYILAFAFTGILGFLITFILSLTIFFITYFVIKKRIKKFDDNLTKQIEENKEKLMEMIEREKQSNKFMEEKLNERRKSSPENTRTAGIGELNRDKEGILEIGSKRPIERRSQLQNGSISDIDSNIRNNEEDWADFS